MTASAADTLALSKMTPEDLIKEIMALREELRTERDEFDEYKASSREMEEIFESDLAEAKKKLKEAERRLASTDLELHRLQERSDAQKKEALKIEETLRKELKSNVEERELSRTKIRKLEQRNDDLERAERNNQQMLHDLAEQLNAAVERTALLENEIADKQATSEEMYRLREELKERPRLVVGPLRMERGDETPDEPMPDEKPKMRLSAGGDAMDTTPPPCTPTKLAPVLPEGRGFASSVNRIVSDLMVKVNRLEGMLHNVRIHN